MDPELQPLPEELLTVIASRRGRMSFLKNITSGRSTMFQWKSHILVHTQHKLDLIGGKGKEEIKLSRLGKVVGV